jgi:hypothetical protein
VLFNASMSMSKQELALALRKLRDAGFVCDGGWYWIFRYEYEDFDVVRKDALVEALRSMSVPEEIFGFSEVVVDKDEENKRWIVRQPSGSTLCQIPWTHFFDWARVAFGANGGDILAALEACCFLQPLTDAEIDSVLATRPDLRPKARFPCDPANWEAADSPEEVLEGREKTKVKDSRSPTPEHSRSLSKSRKISL